MNNSGDIWAFSLALSNRDGSDSFCLTIQLCSRARAEPLCNAAFSRHWDIYKLPSEIGWRRDEDFVRLLFSSSALGRSWEEKVEVLGKITFPQQALEGH